MWGLEAREARRYQAVGDRCLSPSPLPPPPNCWVSARGLGLLSAGAHDQGCRQTGPPTQHSQDGLQRCVGGAVSWPLGFHLWLRYNPRPWSTPQVPAASSHWVTHKAGVVLCVQAVRRRVEKTLLLVRQSRGYARTGDVCMAQVQSPPPPPQLCPPCPTPLPVCRHTPPHSPPPTRLGLWREWAMGSLLHSVVLSERHNRVLVIHEFGAEAVPVAPRPLH